MADKGRNAEVDFHGQKRSNETHASVTDPDARLYRKGEGKEAKLCYMGHALMENRNGLVVDACLTQADGHAERNAALAMIEPRADRPVRITLGADKGYDAEDFVNELRSMNVTPHVAAKAKGSAIDGRTTRHAGYAVSQRIRKRIEEPFGWSKTVGLSPRPCCAVSDVSAPSSSSPSPPTTLPACPSCSPHKEKSRAAGYLHATRLRKGSQEEIRFYPRYFFSSLLEPIFEADLPPEQYGYRPGRNAQQAVTEVQALMFRGRPDIVDADLADYFGSIPHADLLKSVARRIVDRRVLHLIKMWLECPVEETDDRGRKTRTTGANDTGAAFRKVHPFRPCWPIFTCAGLCWGGRCWDLSKSSAPAL